MSEVSVVIGFQTEPLLVMSDYSGVGLDLGPSQNALEDVSR